MTSSFTIKDKDEIVRQFERYLRQLHPDFHSIEPDPSSLTFTVRFIDNNRNQFWVMSISYEMLIYHTSLEYLKSIAENAVESYVVAKNRPSSVSLPPLETDLPMWERVDAYVHLSDELVS